MCVVVTRCSKSCIWLLAGRFWVQSGSGTLLPTACLTPHPLDLDWVVLMDGCGLVLSPAIYDAAAVSKFSQHPQKFSLFQRGSGHRLRFCRCTGTPPPTSCVGPQVAFHILQTAPQRGDVCYDAKLPQQEAITALCCSAPSAAAMTLNWFKSPRWGRCDCCLCCWVDVTLVSSLSPAEDPPHTHTPSPHASLQM